MRQNATISEGAAASYSHKSLPLLPRRVEEQLLHSVSWGTEAGKLPVQRLNGTAAAAEKAIAQGRQAVGIVARANLRLAIKHAQSYRPDTTREGWDDLIQRSYLALCHAATRYDLRHVASARYTTYAMFWVRQQTSHEFKKAGRMSAPDGRAVRSLDAPLKTLAEDGNFTLIDTISDPEAEALFAAAEAEHDLAAFLQLLPARERRAVSLYYNVDGNATADGERRSYEEVGELMGGISGEKARKITLTGVARIWNHISAQTGEQPRQDPVVSAAVWDPKWLSDTAIQLDLFD